MFLPPSPLPKAVPAAGRFLLPLTTFSLLFLLHPSRAARALQKSWLQRRPSHSRLIYQGFLHRRRPPSRPPVRLCPSQPCLAFQPLRRRRRADEQRQRQVVQLRCKLWIRARRDPSAIFQMRYNPAASPTAAAGFARRCDPCSCPLAGPHGSTIVQPRPHRAYIGTPVSRLTPSPGDTPTLHTRSDVLGDADDLCFADTVVRYSHDDWKREQHGGPTCHVMICYVCVGRPSVLPPDVLAWYRRFGVLPLATPRTSIHPSQTFRSWEVKFDHIQRTRTSSKSSVTRHRRHQRLTIPTLRGELLACQTTSRFPCTSPCSCALRSCQLVTQRPLDTWASRTRCPCWSGLIGGLA